MVLITAIMGAGSSGNAVAKSHKGHWRHHKCAYESRTQVVPQQPAHLGSMRYYGGPKSPMWREVN
jgi:hypothetical protein